MDPLGLDYKDVNVTLGWLIGGTGGALVDGCQIYPYLGGGIMTPGLGGALTASPYSPSQGWNFGFQISVGISWQVGYALDGGWFWEIGVGGGFPTFFSAALTGYYIFPPTMSTNCQPSQSKSSS